MLHDTESIRTPEQQPARTVFTPELPELPAIFQNDSEIVRYTWFSRSQFEIFLKYPLRVENHKPGAVYTLRICMGGKRDNKASGTVWLRYFEDTGIDIP